MENKGTRTLETDRLILRQFRINDAENMFKNWTSDPEVTKFLSWPPHVDVNLTRSLLADWISRYWLLYGKSLVGKSNYAGGFGCSYQISV